MRRTSRSKSRKANSARLVSYRPAVQVLEDRLPPGDVLLGGRLTSSWLEPDWAVARAASLAAIDSQAERQFVGPSAQANHATVTPTYASAASVLFAYGIAASQAEPAPLSADSAREKQGIEQGKTAYQEMAGLNDQLLDRLLADDLGELPSSSSVHGKALNGTGGMSDGKPPAPEAGASSSAGGAMASLGAGTGGPLTPFVPSSLNGAGLGNAAPGSAAGAAPSSPATPNLVTTGLFANSTTSNSVSATSTTWRPVDGSGTGGPQGNIRPLVSSVVWPSYTPPLSGGSGGSTSSSGGPVISSSGGSIQVNSFSGGRSVPTSMTSGGGSGGGTSGNSGGGVSGGGTSGGGNTGSGVSGGGTSGGGASGGGVSGGGVSGGGNSGGGNSGGCDCGCSGGGGSGGAGSGGTSSGSMTGMLLSPFMIDNAAGVADHSIASGSAVSPSGVRYFDGEVNVASTDLSSSGFGGTWNQTRSWSNGSPPSSFNGTGMIDMDRPYLLRPNGDDSQIVVVSSASNARFFNLVNSVYVPQFFVQDQLTHPTGEFLLTDTTGNTLHFYDFTAAQANQRGQFKSCTDPKGNTLSVTSWTVDGKVVEMQRSDSGLGLTESYLYTYLAAPDPNAGLIATITLRRQVGGSWSTVRQVAYDYYDGTGQKPYGNLGDLRTATIKDANNNVLDTTYDRYYTASDAGTIGYVHGRKYSFSAQSYARLAAGVANPLTATDTQVAPYADDYFEYDPTSQRVTKAVVQGSGCSVCTGGQGTFTYAYSASAFSNNYNSWADKTVETLPDGSTHTVYANYAGETMLEVFQSGTQKWETFYKYDSAGRIILKANPSAVTGYNEAYADLLDQSQVGDYGYLSSTTGLIELTDYYTTTTATSTTAGGVAGYYQDTKLEQGKSGTPILQMGVQYFSRTGGSTIYPMATSTVYRNTDGTGAETTSYAYTWYTGTTQQQTMTVTKPIISSAQNGPGTADVITYSYDAVGRVTQLTDADGFITTYQYDQATGAFTQTVVDVGTGHLNLTTTMVVDALGRTTKLTDPNGNVTYTIYKDATHEVRTYAGWTGTTTTGPTQVYREDRAHDPSYTETLIMSSPPHVTNGQPDGSEDIAYLQSLSRTITSRGGQVSEKDTYFYLGGIAYTTATYLGTAGTNYYATQYTYDTPRGWLTRVLAPTGTITRTVYDALGRVVSTWVGTNDTPGSGSWSPSNNTPPSNMVQVTGNVYDGGGIGDSTVTQVTQYPGGTAAARVSQNYFDWRDRLVASKQGVQASESDGTHRPIVYSQFDNLSEVVSSERYDGDGVSSARPFWESGF